MQTLLNGIHVFTIYCYKNNKRCLQSATRVYHRLGEKQQWRGATTFGRRCILAYYSVRSMLRVYKMAQLTTQWQGSASPAAAIHIHDRHYSVWNGVREYYNWISVHQKSEQQGNREGAPAISSSWMKLAGRNERREGSDGGWFDGLVRGRKYFWCNLWITFLLHGHDLILFDVVGNIGTE